MRIIKYFFLGIPATAILVVTLAIVGVFDKGAIRSVLDKVTSGGEKAKPEIYHEAQGYSPGKYKSQVEEDFNRYHFYIALDDDWYNSEPEIIFRQDYDYDYPEGSSFDEDKYWQDFPLDYDNYPPETNEKVEELLDE